jgi:hypothetical protein
MLQGEGYFTIGAEDSWHVLPVHAFVTDGVSQSGLMYPSNLRRNQSTRELAVSLVPAIDYSFAAIK